MKLAIHLHEKCVKTNAGADNKESALRVIAGIAGRHPQLKDVREDTIFKGFMEREKVGSTGFGNFIAIPHFATEDISEFVVGIVTFPQGVEYETIDGKPAKLFVFVIAPQTKRNQHLGILSSIARFFRVEENVKTVLGIDSEKDLYDFILKQRPEMEDVKISYDYNLISVAVQIEEKFEDIIDIFTESEDVNLSVFEAENADKYLYNMPLFASFWTSEEQGFHRIINCTVKKTSTNQILQKINKIIETIADGKGIMVTVQDLIYHNGTLNI